jgi:hypothetical protein
VTLIAWEAIADADEAEPVTVQTTGGGELNEEENVTAEELDPSAGTLP